MSKTLRIDTDTAKFYLRVEHAFQELCSKLNLDPDIYLNIDPNVRYGFRCDLHDNWEAAVKKPDDYKPHKQQRAFRAIDLPTPRRK